MAPERITGQSYTITSDVWSLGVTLLEVAQHRFPFPADGTEMQPKAGLIDLLTYIVRQSIPTLKDEEENKIKWSENFKYFIECWYVPTSNLIYISLTQPHPVSKKNPPAAPRRGACSNIPGWWRCRARRSTCNTFWRKCGTGRIREPFLISPRVLRNDMVISCLDKVFHLTFHLFLGQDQR
jgi:serine/threonine protein kinase